MSGNLFAEIFKAERDTQSAVMFEQRDITYRELRDLTIATAERLNALNIHPGERVAILLNDSPEFIASFVALISLGAIAVPINMALRKSEQLTILKDCGARMAIFFIRPHSTPGYASISRRKSTFTNWCDLLHIPP